MLKIVIIIVLCLAVVVGGFLLMGINMPEQSASNVAIVSATDSDLQNIYANTDINISTDDVLDMEAMCLEPTDGNQKIVYNGQYKDLKLIKEAEITLYPLLDYGEDVVDSPRFKRVANKEPYKFVHKITDMYGVVEYDLDFCYQVPEKARIFLLEKWKTIPFTAEELTLEKTDEKMEENTETEKTV